MNGLLFLLFAVLFVSLFFFLPLPQFSSWFANRRRRSGKQFLRPESGRQADDRLNADERWRGTDVLKAANRTAGTAAQKSERAALGVPTQSPKLPELRLAQLRYRGGDWQCCPQALAKLADFYQANCEPDRPYSVEFGVDGRDLLGLHPHFVFASGHYGFELEESDLQGVLQYLGAGGFVLIEDNNGMDGAFRGFLDRRLPTHKLVPGPSFPFFADPFAVTAWPKVRRHQGKAAVLYQIQINNKAPDFYYSFSADLGDGWQNREVLRVDAAKRRAALEAGANLLAYALRQPIAG